jgi:RNA-directed DNA polymerase
MTFTSLAHHIDVEFLREAYRRTRKDGAVGVDGVTAEAYAVALESNLQSLLTRFRSGTYFAPPVRRVHIPKGDGTQTRPIGIPTFEDKVLQKAVKMVLEAVYEQDFLPCSYGFRPGRSQHDALSSLRGAIMDMRAGWLIDLDVEKFFDSVDHGHLRAILDQRVRDGVLRKAIDKWLKAGVMEEGVERHPEDGTPQGASAITPNPATRDRLKTGHPVVQGPWSSTARQRSGASLWRDACASYADRTAGRGRGEAGGREGPTPPPCRRAACPNPRRGGSM